MIRPIPTPPIHRNRKLRYLRTGGGYLIGECPCPQYDREQAAITLPLSRSKPFLSSAVADPIVFVREEFGMWPFVAKIPLWTGVRYGGGCDHCLRHSRTQFA